MSSGDNFNYNNNGEISDFSGTDIVNVVVVGDSGIGKTNMILSYAQDSFSSEYKPTVFDHYSSEVEYNGHPCSLEIWDLSGKDEHQSLRKFAYSKAQAIVICYSMMDSKSFKSVQSKWLREIRSDEKLKSIPLILVATKCDQFEDHDTLESFKKSGRVDSSQGSNLAKFEGFIQYIETSALFGECVKNVFDEALYATLKNNQKYGGSQSGNRIRKAKHDDNDKNKKCIVF
eukprot:403333325